MTGSPLPMVAYWEPKAGSARSEWEDGAAYSPSTGRFAVADGASTSTRAREWAYALTSEFVRDPPPLAGTAASPTSSFSRWVDRVRSSFDPDDPRFAPARTPEWVQRQARERGAHATFLGGRVGDGRVTAVANGDCCLFHVGGDGDATTFPATEPDDFGHSPDLLASVGHGGRTRPRIYDRPFGRGDTVFVASDAFAEWLVTAIRVRAVVAMLRRIGAAGFRDLCRELRDGGLMKNDDVTFLRIEGTPT